MTYIVPCLYDLFDSVTLRKYTIDDLLVSRQQLCNEINNIQPSLPLHIKVISFYRFIRYGNF
jgi:hypothetical protein